MYLDINSIELLLFPICFDNKEVKLIGVVAVM